MSTPEISPAQPQEKRPPRKFWQMFIGAYSIFAGTVIGLLMVRGLMLPGNLRSSAWNIGGVFVFCLLSIYLIWIGSRAVRRGRGQIVPSPAIRWGRALGGVWLIFFSLYSRFNPGPNDLKANGVAEAFGMFMGTVLMAGGGIILLVSSFRVWLRELRRRS
jgi:hypothetical protein